MVSFGSILSISPASAQVSFIDKRECREIATANVRYFQGQQKGPDGSDCPFDSRTMACSLPDTCILSAFEDSIRRSFDRQAP